MKEKGDWEKEIETHPRRKTMVMTYEDLVRELRKLGYTEEEIGRVKLGPPPKE